MGTELYFNQVSLVTSSESSRSFRFHFFSLNEISPDRALEKAGDTIREFAEFIFGIEKYRELQDLELFTYQNFIFAGEFLTPLELSVHADGTNRVYKSGDGVIGLRTNLSYEQKTRAYAAGRHALILCRTKIRSYSEPESDKPSKLYDFHILDSFTYRTIGRIDVEIQSVQPESILHETVSDAREIGFFRATPKNMFNVMTLNSSAREIIEEYCIGDSNSPYGEGNYVETRMYDTFYHGEKFDMHIQFSDITKKFGSETVEKMKADFSEIVHSTIKEGIPKRYGILSDQNFVAIYYAPSKYVGEIFEAARRIFKMTN